MKTTEYVLLEQMLASANQESDRGCVLILTANLDNRLRKLCQNFFIDLESKLEKDIFSGNGYLATFSSRIDMSFALGLLGVNEHYDLHLIRKIRNDFAHNELTITFESQSIKDRCRELRMVREMKVDYPNLAHNVQQTRNAFQITVFSLCLVIMARNETALASKRTIPASTSILPKS